MLRIKQLPSFDSVAAAAKAVCSLPLGLRYHVIWLMLGNAAVAMRASCESRCKFQRLN